MFPVAPFQTSEEEARGTAPLKPQNFSLQESTHCRHRSW